MGSRTKKPSTKRRTKKTKGRRLRRTPQPLSVLKIMERLLARRVPIRLSGELQYVTALEAIVLQLTQKAASSGARAVRVLGKYWVFAKRHTEKTTKVRFADSPY